MTKKNTKVTRERGEGERKDLALGLEKGFYHAC